jgi:hypothetical protein
MKKNEVMLYNTCTKMEIESVPKADKEVVAKVHLVILEH